MSERPDDQTPPDADGEESPESAPATGADAVREQVPAHIPPHLRDLFTKHEGAVAAKPGFRNPPNAKAKKQRKKTKKKGRK